MTNKNQLLTQISKDSNILHISFDHLNQANYDIGYNTIVKNGRHYHQITRDITVSMQKFHNGTLINMLYSNGQPVYIHLTDGEVIPYYSDYIEWRYILTGRLKMEFEGKTAIFEENEICFIDSAAYHRELIKESECVTINIGINRGFFTQRFISGISLTPLQKFLRTNVLHTGQIEKYLKFTSVSSDTAEITDCIFTILNEARLQKSGYLDICRGYLVRLMDILSTGYRFGFSKNDSSKYYNSLFESISEFMRRNINTVTMDSLIEAFHYQSNFFNNLIKRYTGLTYSGYLISLRVERAKELLETTALPIEEIIWLVGYHNKGFFYRQFTGITGTSPAHYRRAAASDGAPLS